MNSSSLCSVDHLQRAQPTSPTARMEEGIMELDVLEGIFDGRTEPKDLKLSALQSITGNFSEGRIIGTGGFGTVYKGVLQNGEVAVKRIKNNHTIDEKVFRREVNSMLNVSHENIVRFLGFCSHTEHKVFENEGSRNYIYAESRERILCFEYISNGSLENYIADELRGLPWDTRYFIIKGICQGLQYLHMEKQIIHMDLKPANVLIGYNMVAKITDFGLSRMEENAQTKSTTRASSPGYTAPEYIDKGEMSVKYDVYSLGIIIIELVTGHRGIPDSNNVLRRWRHRLHKSGKEAPFRYLQIAKLIEIGLLCQEKDPYKRPFISDIIRVINELESTDRKISNVRESTITPYSEDDMLGIEPLELRFPFKINSHITCSLDLTNETTTFIAFSVQTTSPLPYCIQPNKDIVAPQSKYRVNITLQPIDKVPQDKYTGNFIVRSTRVKESLIDEDITEDVFNKDDGKLVDEVKLTITYKGEVPQVDLSLDSLIISETTNLHGAQESNVPPIEAESKTSVSTSDEVIQFDRPKLCFPLVPNKNVLSSFKIINVTEYYVTFTLTYSRKNTTAQYIFKPCESILSPRSTQWIQVIREKEEDAVKDMQFNDILYAWYAIVDEDMEVCDIDAKDYKEWRKLPIVLTEMNPCTSKELIQFDPPELSFPCLNKTLLSSFNIVNITDFYIGFNIWYFAKYVESYDPEPGRGVLTPRSTQRIVVKRVPKGKESEGMQCESNLFAWNMIVAEDVEASNIRGYVSDEDSKELPSICKTISPCTTDMLIRLDHPGIHFTFSQNKMAISSINMVNVTDYYIGFHLFNGDTNVVRYEPSPKLGILAPRCAQRVLVARLIDHDEPEDMQYNDKFFMWNSIVSEDIKDSDLDCYMSSEEEESNELPIILNRVTPSTSVELIKLEPPEVCFPFLPSKRLSSSIKIVNITDYHIGFNTAVEETNVASYITEPECGILPPWSTQELVVTRVAKDEAPELEDMQCKDKFFVWSCFVTEDVSASNLKTWRPKTGTMELPIVFTKTSSNELIQFDPPELSLPWVPNQRVLSSAKIVNVTDQYIGFRICTKKSNSARYNANPSEGILPPLSTQVLLVTRIAEEKELDDTQCTDKFLVWNGIVTEDVKASDVIDNMSEIKCTDLPIVLTKTSSSTSDELIQFDPPELQFPLLQNKKVMTSIKIVNLTDYNVGFKTYSRQTNAAWYHTEPPRGILPPRSTKKLMVTREEKEDASSNQFNDKYFVWKSIISEGVKDSDLGDYISDLESQELPILLDKLCSSIPNELIQFDPAELCIPLLLNTRMMFKVNIVNSTDFNVAFDAYWIGKNEPWCRKPRGKGILPPRSTKTHTISWVTTEAELEDMECLDDYFVWNRVVTEGVESGDIISDMCQEESKKLPLILSKASPCTSDERIQFDPPELSLPLMPNNQLVFSVNVVNNTDYCVGFHRANLPRSVANYYPTPPSGVMPPRSTQRLVVKRIPKKTEQEDMQCVDKFLLWSHLVSEGFEPSDLLKYVDLKGTRELPVVYNKTSLSTSDELVQFDPPQLTFPFLPNKRVSMLRKFKVVNLTDHNVGFRTWSHKDNSAWYIMEPPTGILPPQSTQAIKVRRTLNVKQTEDMECKDKIFLWNGIVTEGVEVSDVDKYSTSDDKELPVFLTKPGETSSR